MESTKRKFDPHPFDEDSDESDTDIWKRLKRNYDESGGSGSDMDEEGDNDEGITQRGTVNPHLSCLLPRQSEGTVELVVNSRGIGSIPNDQNKSGI